MMPDLPNVGWERDLESFSQFFEDPAFRADGLKVCVVALWCVVLRGVLCCVVVWCGVVLGAGVGVVWRSWAPAPR